MGHREQRTLRAFEAVIRMQQLIVAKATDRERAEVCDEAVLTLALSCIAVVALYPLDMSLHFIAPIFVTRSIYHDRQMKMTLAMMVLPAIAAITLLIAPYGAELAAGMTAGLLAASLIHRVGMLEGLKRSQRLHAANSAGIAVALVIAALTRLVGGKALDPEEITVAALYLTVSSAALTSAYAVWRGRIDAAVKKEIMGP